MDSSSSSTSATSAAATTGSPPSALFNATSAEENINNSATSAASASAAAADRSPSASPVSTGVDADGDAPMLEYCCTLIDQPVWDSHARIEKRLKEYDIPYKGVYKRKGREENTATVYFHNEEEMNAAIAKMSDIRDEPKSSSQSMPGRLIFKVREPRTISTRKRKAPAADTTGSPRARSEASDNKEEQPAKRARILIQAGDAGYAAVVAERKEAAESATPRNAAEADADEPMPAALSGAVEVEATVNDIVVPLWRKPYEQQLIIKRAELRTLMQQTTKAWKREYGRDLIFPHMTYEEENDMNAEKIAKTKEEIVKAEATDRRTEAIECVEAASAATTDASSASAVSALTAPSPNNNPTARRPRRVAMFCPLDPVLPSPVLEGYRNKCEFSFGFNAAGEATIGFLMGKFTDGIVRVEAVDECPHIPRIAKSIVSTMTQFVRANVATYLPYDKRAHSGFWRTMTVRNSESTKQCMILIQVSPAGKSEAEMLEFRRALMHFLTTAITSNPSWSAENDAYELKAVGLQLHSGVSNAAPDDLASELLYGVEASIQETLCGLTFRVSQQAFFQINSLGAERLYSVAADFAKLPAVDAPQAEKDKHVLFDVCCGTGTIGLSLAHRVGQVIGLEMNAAAIADAKYNAEANRIKNAHFFVGKAEDTIHTALTEYVPPLTGAGARDDVIVTAIVDPPRAGLHPDVVRLLRRCARIERIVYVSCNPKTLMENVQRLIQPASKKFTGTPFIAIHATPVDMFPATHHCELVMLLERPRVNKQTDTSAVKEPKTSTQQTSPSPPPQPQQQQQSEPQAPPTAAVKSEAHTPAVQSPSLA